MGITQAQCTLDEFLRLPETKPASEYHHGRITRKVSPRGQHSRQQGVWVTKLGSLPEASRTGLVFPELRCTFAGRSIVPDVSFIVFDRIPRDPSGAIADEVSVPPDLVIEILSPGQKARDISEKLAFYVGNGVRLGWFIDPMKKRVTIFRPDRAPETIEEGVLDAAPFIPGLTFTVAEVFGWLVPPA